MRDVKGRKIIHLVKVDDDDFFSEGWWYWDVTFQPFPVWSMEDPDNPFYTNDVIRVIYHHFKTRKSFDRKEKEIKKLSA